MVWGFGGRPRKTTIYGIQRESLLLDVVLYGCEISLRYTEIEKGRRGEKIREFPEKNGSKKTENGS